MTQGLSGTQLGRYTVGDVIGTGGFATVYQAHDEGLDTNVAIKVLAENHAMDPETRERFLSEGRFLRRIDHPNVIQVHDLGETEGHQPYLVLQLANRGTLAQRLDALGGMGLQATESDAEQLALSLTEALQAIHDAGLVHRDLSPNNVFLISSGGEPAAAGQTGLIANDERMVLGDLGLAKDLAAASGLTAGAGTAEYAAPEQRTPFGQVTQASDVYGASALFRRVVSETPFSNRFGAALQTGLAEDPNDRPQTISAWHAVVSGPAPADMPSSSGVGAWRQRSLAVIALLLLGVFAWWLSTRASDPDTQAAAAVERAAVVILAGDPGAGWYNQSWGEPLPIIPPDTLVTFAPFAAVSMMTDEPVAIERAQYLIYTVQNLDPALQLAVVLNENSAAPCILQGTDMVTPAAIVVPFSVLGVADDEVWRVSLQHGVGPDAPSFSLSSITISADPPFRPTNDCADQPLPG